MTQLSLVENKVPGEVEERLEEIAKGIETVQATAIIKIGERLAEARDLFRYDRKEKGFEGWCEARLKISRSTAYNMISVFERLGESVQGLGHFDQIGREALYALAAPSTPEEVRAEVEQLLIDGQKITAADVRRMREMVLAARESAEHLEARAKAASRRALELEEQVRKQPLDADAIAEQVEQRVRSEVQVEADQRVARLSAEKRALREQLEALQRRIDRLTSPEVETVEESTALNVVRLPVEEVASDDPMNDTDPTHGEDAMHQIGGSLAIMLNTRIDPPEFWRMSHRYPASRADLHEKVLRGLTMLARLAEGYDQ